MQMRKAVVIVVAIGALGATTAAVASRTHRLRAPDPGGYSVECRGDACFQLGRRVSFIVHGGFTRRTQRDCRAFGLKPSVLLPRRRDYFWQPISDPVPDAPPTADTYVCGPPGVNLVYVRRG
jgi:hypothetical protein